MNALRRRRLLDRFAKVLISAGGIFIIVSILAMMVFIASEAIPLWSKTRIEPADEVRPSALSRAGSTPALAPIVGTNEYQELLLAVSERGYAEVVRLPGGSSLWSDSLPEFASTPIRAAAPLDAAGIEWLVGTSNGDVHFLRLESNLEVLEDGRHYRPEVIVSAAIPIAPGREIRTVAGTRAESGVLALIYAGDDSLHLVGREESRNLFGEVRTSETHGRTSLGGRVPTALAVGYGGDRVYVGTDAGTLLAFRSDPTSGFAAPVETAVLSNSGITALGMLNGGHSLVVGGSRGEVELWFPARAVEADAPERLFRARAFRPHDAAVMGVVASRRDRSFATWDRNGRVHLQHGTTRAQLAAFDVGSTAPTTLCFATRGDGLTAAGGDGRVRIYRVEAPHVDFSFGAALQKVQYEGSSRSEYVWQSTGSTDEFEPKLSLVPLLFGTMKGTWYALLFSVPIAILAATYTALFMHPRLRAIIKPTMELMAALPSVVLGFLAGLWLAPILERAMPGFLLLPLVLPGVVLLTGALWRRLPRQTRSQVMPGAESLGLVVLLALAIQLVFSTNVALNRAFDGGFLNWLYQSMHIRYDQRNALVIGVAMGLAVIPIIFTISEDSISNVPRSLWAGSLALGATPWQTAWRVILPAASPGIFSAVMIGFGRAVGETMIVLMATGNTPIMDWGPLNGFRTMAANIAVEIPEAPHHGTLYRVLFLTAFVLFLITFVANTAAEIVRNRLRRQFSRF